MLQTLFAWFAVLLLIVAAYPWTRVLLARGTEDDTRLLAYTLTPGLTIGALTLIMFWLGLFGIRFNAASIGLPYAALCLLGLWLWARANQSSPDTSSSHILIPYPLFLIPAILIAAAILFNAAYWPFSRDDTLGIYQPFAQMLAESRTLVPLTGADSLYRAYPMALPLAYAFTYILSGWENEYLARIIPALLSIGCLPAAYLIGRRLLPGRTGAQKLAGILSALIIAFTPTFVRWASSGYVDLPLAYFWALTVLFCLRLLERGAPVDALLAGICLGLAAWTKNAALAGVPLLVGTLAWAVWRKRIRLTTALLSLIAFAVVAAPWYARNLIGAGFLMPDTAWTDQAQRTLGNLVPFLIRPQDYGLMGWVITGGLIMALWQVARAALAPKGSPPSSPRAEHRIPSTEHRALSTEHRLLLIWWIVPYFLIWWLFASYDPRFLLHLLPLLAALGGGLLAMAWAGVPQTWRGRLQIVLAVAALILTVQSILTAVEFKNDLLRDPLMAHETKIAIVRPAPSEQR